MTAVATDARRTLARTAAAAVTALAGACGLAWLVTNVPARQWPAEPVTAVTLQGEHYRVSPADLRWLASFSELHFSAGEQEAREVVAEAIAAQLDPTFAQARARLPQFADWYYSLRGEYSRLAMAALSLADLGEPDYVANQAAERLFPDRSWEADLAELQRSAEARLAAHSERVRAGWLAEVTRRLAAQRVPAPLPGDDASAAPIELDGLLGGIAERERAALQSRVSVSTLAAAGAAAGPAIWSAAAARRAATAGRAAGGRAAARAAGRGAARVGSAVAGGAAVCAPSGPAAVVCALLAGAAVWLGTDWALLQLDEHYNRDDLLAALDATLTDVQAQIETTLLAAYDEVLAAYYGGVQNDIQNSFVPAAAGL